MAAENRFAIASEDEISALVKNRDSKSTQKVVNKAKNTFKNFLAANEFDENFELLDKKELNEKLRLFFASIKKKPVQEGEAAESYKKNSYNNIKYGLSKYIKEHMGHDINDKHDTDFASSQEVYDSILKKLKQTGMAKTAHYPPITEEDMDRLYTHRHVFNVDTPFGLQNKVWFELMYYFCRRGQENLRSMTKATFAVKTDASGKRFVFQAIDEATKNHSANDKPHDTNGEAAMYELPGNSRCPVASFLKYVDKLHPDCDALWQRPLDSFLEEEPIWYYNKPVGRDTLGAKMKSISKMAKLHHDYTNHSIRATHITTLDNAGFEARDIMRTSGHKSETSIRSYSHTLSDAKKRRISSTLSKNTGQDSDQLPLPANSMLKQAVPEPLVVKATPAQAIPTVAPVPDAGEDIPFDELSDMELVQSAGPTIDVQTNSMAGFSFCPNFTNCQVTINFQNMRNPSSN